MQSQSYRLCRETRAIATIDGKSTVLTIPTGSIITVVDPQPVLEPPPTEAEMVAVEWDDKIVKMFAVDVEQRGERVQRGASQN